MPRAGSLRGDRQIASEHAARHPVMSKTSRFMSKVTEFACLPERDSDTPRLSLRWLESLLHEHRTHRGTERCLQVLCETTTRIYVSFSRPSVQWPHRCY